LRQNKLNEATNTEFDLIIIGGGITGAGIFLKAVKRGLKVLLLDKNDFASGTSSRSSKLVHGGLRYLAHMQIKLVYEGLNEREHLLQEYPHLVKPQPFFMPVYHKWVDRLKFSVGLTGYDMLQGKSLMPKHISIPREDIAIKYPQIVTEDLKGGFYYYDARTNDARLTNEVIQQAVSLGGIAINYMTVAHLNKNYNSIKSITAIDTFTSKEYNFTSKFVVSATGVWTDHLLQKVEKINKKIMKPSKGIHVVVSGDFFPKDAVLILPSIEGDGRFIWCVPWEDNLNVIGTTDTDFEGDIDDLFTTKIEAHYLLDAVNKYLKDTKINENDILSVYAGLRPLLSDTNNENEIDEDEDSTSRSRDYEIWWNNDNMLTIAGGKLTSFLSMAENVINTIEEKYPEILIQNIPLELNKKKAKVPSFPMYQQLRQQYGDENTLIIYNIIQEDESLGYRFDVKYKYLKAEIIFFIRHQHAITLDDILTRRTLISYNMRDWDEKLIVQVCMLFQIELNWSDQDVTIQIENYKIAWNKMHILHS
jgi:glycerol-3-phosphate dehydrogenase